MKTFLIVVAGTVAIAAAVCFTLIVLMWFGLSKQSISVVQELKSPDRIHTARLVRKSFIDLNFQVRVDGRRVYGSPDFRPNPSAPFRETLLWDDSSRFVILEIAGRRLFGYDTLEKRKLTNQELTSLSIPETAIEQLGFEGIWPQTTIKEASNKTGGR